MKTNFKQLTLYLFISLLCGKVFAQSPQSFKYQAALRDNVGQILVNENLILEFKLLEDSPTGTVAYTETHNVTTNSYGLINVEIGRGSTSGHFNLLQWNQHKYYLETSINRGNGFIVLGTSPLVSVPYALHAHTASNVNDADADTLNEIQSLSLLNDTIWLNKGGFVSLKQYSDSISNNSKVITRIDTTLTNQISLIQSNQNIANQASTNATNAQAAIINHIVQDKDTLSTNEIQVLNLTNDSLFLTKGGVISLHHLNDSLEIVSLRSKLINDSSTLQNEINQQKVLLSFLNTKQGLDSNLLRTLIVTNETNLSNLELKVSGDSTILQNQISNNTIDISNLSVEIDSDSSTFQTLINQQQAVSTALINKQVNDSSLLRYLINTNQLNLNNLQIATSADSALFRSLINKNTANLLSFLVKQTSDSLSFQNGINTNSNNLSTLQSNLSTHVGNDLDISANNELQSLSISNNTLSISSGNSVNLSALQDGIGTDDQTLSLNGNSLTIESGNTVSLSTINTDQQQLSLSGNSLQLTNGGAVLIDTDPDNELQLLSISGDTLTLQPVDQRSRSSILLPQGFSGQFSHLLNIPAGLLDGDDDTNTQLSESQVDAFVANNNYLTNEVDGSITNEIQTLSRMGSTITLSLGGGSFTDSVNTYVGGSGISIIGNTISSTGDNDTQLSEAQVDAFVANNNYLTSEVDGSVTNELELPTNPAFGDMTYWDGTAWVLIPNTTNQGAVLTALNGVPTWVGGTPPSSTIPATVGDFRDGGIVFWVDPTDNTHGLVVMASDLGIFPWGCQGTLLGVTNSTIGSGTQNTLDIISNCSSASTAAYACDTLTLNGYSDWFLPSKDEANEIFTNKAIIDATAISNGGSTLFEIIAGSSTFDYWTSTEVDLFIAHPDVRLNGAGAGFKSDNLRVRAVRAF